MGPVPGVRTSFVVAAVAIAALASAGVAAAASPVTQLVERYAPVLELSTDTYGCHDAAPFVPVNVNVLLPNDEKGRPRAARRFDACAAIAARKLGGVYHAERFWLFLPSGEGVPEIRHPMEMTEI